MFCGLRAGLSSAQMTLLEIDNFLPRGRVMMMITLGVCIFGLAGLSAALITLLEPLCQWRSFLAPTLAVYHSFD